jgi:hypothetical protein
MKVSYPRRQQLRRLGQAASRGAGAGIALGAAALLTAACESGVALMLGLLSGVLALASRRALRLTGRSRVGAESEAQVRRTLERLADDGWRVRHAVDWPGRGDLDHVVRAPSGTGFVIETKTLRWTRDHVVRTFDAARWLARRRRRYPHGVMPVLCVTRARRVERVDRDLLIVSLDRLLSALRAAAQFGPWAGAAPLAGSPAGRLPPNPPDARQQLDVVGHNVEPAAPLRGTGA